MLLKRVKWHTILGETNINWQYVSYERFDCCLFGGSNCVFTLHEYSYTWLVCWSHSFIFAVTVCHLCFFFSLVMLILYYFLSKLPHTEFWVGSNRQAVIRQSNSNFRQHGGKGVYESKSKLIHTISSDSRWWGENWWVKWYQSKCWCDFSLFDMCHRVK